MVSKVRPNNSEETILVIPEIVEDDGSNFELNSHILIVDTQTGDILHSYFESSKTNNWVSDAVSLEEISIDTAPYDLTENQRAFGIKVRYLGNARANPYKNETISLFVKSENSLKKVLNNYDMMDFGGDWDTVCHGQFIKEEKVLMLTENSTNGYVDISVKNTITETKKFEDENGDCDEKVTISEQNQVLEFSNGRYQF